MAYCPKCGQQIREGAQFCDSCGLQLGVQQVVQPSQAPGTYASLRTGQSNGTAIAGFVCGLVGIILIWFPWVSIVGIILGVIGLILSGVGLSQANKTGGSGRGMAIAGLVLSIIVVAIFAIALIFSAAFLGIILH